MAQRCLKQYILATKKFYRTLISDFDSIDLDRSYSDFLVIQGKTLFKEKSLLTDISDVLKLSFVK